MNQDFSVHVIVTCTPETADSIDNNSSTMSVTMHNLSVANNNSTIKGQL